VGELSPTEEHGCSRRLKEMISSFLGENEKEVTFQTKQLRVKKEEKNGFEEP